MSAFAANRAHRASIHPDTSLGPVRLTVSDADRSRRFYELATGLQATELDDGGIALGVDGGAPLIEFRGDLSAPALDPRAPGLFHVAILLPGRLELAVALARLAQAQIPLTGASDHLVSEALYLSDPDGNGIEIYRDRPRDEWQVRDGVLQMATLPLDLDSLIAELDGHERLSPTAPAGTRIGHVHLQVSDLAAAEQFYAGVLGFDVTVRGYPGALFVSAGGYHHHLGLNTWNSLGSPPAARDAVGLRSFEIVLPSADELDRVLGRARAAGIETQELSDAWLVRDPFGNGVVLRAR
jgi:catechol 2,3-dioxygenase